MEILNRRLLAILTAILFTFSSQAQLNDNILKAFKASYTNEYKGNYSGAVADIQKAYMADSYEMNLRLGWLCYQAKQFTQSLEYYEKAIGLRKYSVEARFGYIIPANELKKYDKVYVMYEEILKIDPYNSVANYWVGVSYYQAKKYDIALKYLELVVNMYPFDYDANLMLGWTYLALGRNADAGIVFTHALYNRPGDASATDGLSKCK